MSATSPTPHRADPGQIDGKVVAITGASSGIGEAVARAIAFAIGQPAEVDVNQIVVRPTAQLL